MVLKKLVTKRFRDFKKDSKENSKIVEFIELNCQELLVKADFVRKTEGEESYKMDKFSGIRKKRKNLEGRYIELELNRKNEDMNKRLYRD